MQFPTLLLALLSLLLSLTSTLASPTSPFIAPYRTTTTSTHIQQQRNDANTTVWIPTAGPQQFCHNITIDMHLAPEPNTTAPNCRALRAKYAPGVGYRGTQNNGYWNISVDMHASVVNSTWPWSVLAGDENCTFYVATAFLIDPSVNFQLGSVDFVNIIDTVISSKIGYFGHANCTDPSSKKTNPGEFWIGSGRPAGLAGPGQYRS